MLNFNKLLKMKQSFFTLVPGLLLRDGLSVSVAEQEPCNHKKCRKGELPAWRPPTFGQGRQAFGKG